MSFPLNNVLAKRILDLACEIQAIPAPTFEEQQRGQFLSQVFLSEQLMDVEIDPVGNVLGRFPGKGESQHPLIVSAHLDTVFPREVSLNLSRTTEKIKGPGIGDNSLSLASLVGLVWLIKEAKIQLPGDLWLIGTTGEEGLGDLKGIRAVVDRFEKRGNKNPLAYIILEGMGLGEIFNRGLGVRRYRINCQTAGGHSWIDYGKPSAIHELSRFINCITEIPLPDQPKTTLNIGVIHGGTSINTISANAFCELDLRSEQIDVLESLINKIEKLVREMDRPKTGVRFHAEVIGNRPVGEIPDNHPLVRLAKHCLRDLGIQPVPGIGSTDANIPLSRGLSAICIGLTRGSGAHTVEESIYTLPLKQGMEQLFMLVTRAWKSLEKS